jgi:carbonic anhydrase
LRASAHRPECCAPPRISKGLVEASIVTNAALAAYSIQQEFRGSEPTEMQTVYGVYLLEAREIWAPRLDNIAGSGWRQHLKTSTTYLGEAIVQFTTYCIIYQRRKMTLRDLKMSLHPPAN